MASEITQLHQRIECELEGMRAGLFGLTEGNARHAFINRKMHQVGLAEEQLARHIGEAQAMETVCQVYHKVMEPQ